MNNSSPSPMRLAEAVKIKESTKIKGPQGSGSLEVFALHLKPHPMNIAGCKRLIFGKDCVFGKRNRTIMLLGVTGVGKSTLVDGMMNYILGVKWEDTFRFKLVDDGTTKSQAHSQTSEVTAFKLNHREGFQIDYSLTIVDTPGFGCTRGIERDGDIMDQLTFLFSSNLGISKIDAICFVVQSSFHRLTPTQEYVFDSMLSKFGKDVAENIRILVTFADGQTPPVLGVINEAKVPCPKGKNGLPIHFKFNNSALFVNNKGSAVQNGDGDSDEDNEGVFDQMFWDMGNNSMKRFFAALNVIDTKSLTLTKEVLKQRGQLESTIENLQITVKLGLAKLEEIKQEIQILQTHEAEITANRDFEYEVSSMKPVQVDISRTGNDITNCQQCQRTCHYPCAIPNDGDKISCWAMGPHGNCTQRDNKCHWSVHFLQKYRWEYRHVIEERSYPEHKDKYQNSLKEVLTNQDVIKQLMEEYHSLQEDVFILVKDSVECLNRLKEIALRPIPLSTPGYIDLLIEGEKSEAKPGYLERIKKLQSMREKAVTMGKVASCSRCGGRLV